MSDIVDAWQRDALDAIERALRDRLLPAYTDRARRDWTAYPSSVAYPIAWTSERQRRAFFATNGFGGGIPYRRTGKLRAGWTWTLARAPDEMTAEVFNTVPYGRFVVGQDQQLFHARSGWPLPDAVDSAALADALARDVMRALRESLP